MKSDPDSDEPCPEDLLGVPRRTRKQKKSDAKLTAALQEALSSPEYVERQKDSMRRLHRSSRKAFRRRRPLKALQGARKARTDLNVALDAAWTERSGLKSNAG